MKTNHNEELFWLAAVLVMLAIGYLKVHYFWPWFVRWCLGQ
jgi:hypothetical protein